MKTDPRKIDRLEVFKNDIKAADLVRTKIGCDLVFDEKFVANKNSSRLTYKILLDSQTKSYAGYNLPPYFAGLLPEGLRLRAVIKLNKTSADDLFTLLAASGSEPIGSIHFKTKLDNFPEVELPDLETWSALKNVVLKKAKSVRPIAGVQNKLSADERLTLQLAPRENKSFILKFSTDEYKNIVENEFATMELARKCGLETAKVKILKDKHSETSLLVQRFDREWLSAKNKFARYHQEDACQFLDRYPADKYNLSLQEIANGMFQICESPLIELLKLLEVVAFSYLVGNGDLHAKNISVIQRGDSGISELSPCYDLVCTFLYGDRTMALAMEGKSQNFRRKTFIQFGRRFGLSEPALDSMLDRLCGKFEKYSPDFLSFELAEQSKAKLKTLFSERLRHLES